jgi:adenine-specific DNA-methyltransferase
LSYEGLSKDDLIEILRRRDALAVYGLRWERRDIAHDKAVNDDFVGLELEAANSCGPKPWSN